MIINLKKATFDTIIFLRFLKNKKFKAEKFFRKAFANEQITEI